MALRLGNNYLVFIATAAAPTVFTLLGGQQSGTFGDSRSSIDASHKTSGGFNLRVAANRDMSIEVGFIVDLPDTAFANVQAAYNGNLNVVVQIRDAGAAAAAGDAVFTCLMAVAQRNVEMPLNGAVSGTFRFEPVAAPTLDLVLD
jgi:hypothetical protein